jgi:hypothetical protein
MWSARNVGVDRHWEDEFVIFPIEVVKVILPDILDISSMLLVKCRHAYRRIKVTHLGLTQPWELAEFFMNIIGGRSSMYQLPGISTRPVSEPFSSGFIHSSAFLE